MNLQARFIQGVIITATAVPDAVNGVVHAFGGDVVQNGSTTTLTAAPNAEIILVALPSSGQQFDGWFEGNTLRSMDNW